MYNYLVVFFQILTELNFVIDKGTYGVITRDLCSTAITCVRLLTRVIPVLLELQPPQSMMREPTLSETTTVESNQIDGTQTESKFVYDLFWRNREFIDN